MKQISKENYCKISALIDKSYNCVQPQTVLSGENPGFVFADSSEKPNTALIFHKGEEGFYIVGDPNNQAFNSELLIFVEKELKKILKDYEISEFAYGGDSSSWDPILSNIFTNKRVESCIQRVYTNRSLKQYKDSLEEGYELVEVCKNTFELSYSNLNFLEDEIMQWWDSIDDFTKFAFGYLAVKNNEIAGFCLSGGKNDKLHAINIATAENHRKKGIATSLASVMLNRLYSEGLEAYWECTDDNIGSIALAEKFSFNLNFKYNLYWFDL